MTWRSDDFRDWFVAKRVVNGSYRHLTLTEAAERRTAGLAELTRLVSELIAMLASALMS